MQAQTIQHLSAVLKTAYLPAFRNQITTDPSPFMEKIRKVPLTNSTITATAPIGLNGGFSFGDETTAPKAGAQKYASFTLPAKNMYVNIEITDKTVKLASSNSAAMLNAFDQEVRVLTLPLTSTLVVRSSATVRAFSPLEARELEQKETDMLLSRIHLCFVRE